jgi:hypothetical protein
MEKGGGGISLAGWRGMGGSLPEPLALPLLALSLSLSRSPTLRHPEISACRLLASAGTPHRLFFWSPFF